MTPTASTEEPQRDLGECDTPVALSIFSRPECVSRLLAALRPVKPRLLLVFADGPRAERPEEAARCRQARELVAEIDWPCEIRWNVSDVNLGPRSRIQSGLRWTFEQVEEAIFFEEDSIPHPTFLPFCRELLARYRNDPRVLLIAGMRAGSPVPPAGAESYDFSIHPTIHGGWAAWRRTWALYEDNVDSWPALRSSRWLRRIVGDPLEARQWARRFDLVRAGLDTWDYSLVFSFWKARGLAIRPRHHLAENIGFGSQGTNTLDADSEIARRRARPMEFPLVHPREVDSWDAARRARQKKSLGSRVTELARQWRERLRKSVVRHLRPMDRSGRLRRAIRFPHDAPVERLPAVGTSLALADSTIGAHTLPHGWSFPEKEGRWTVGLRAVVAWRTAGEVEHDWICSLEASPALCPSRPGLRVDLFVNDVLCAGSSYGSAVVSRRAKQLDGIERFRIPGVCCSGERRW